MADELDQVALRIMEEERPCARAGKLGGPGFQPKGSQPLALRPVAIGWYFEREMIERRSAQPPAPGR